MADKPENLILRILQEMRDDLGGLRSDMQDLRAELHETREDLTHRVDGNAILLNMLLGIVSKHEERITKLEAR